MRSPTTLPSAFDERVFGIRRRTAEYAVLCTYNQPGLARTHISKEVDTPVALSSMIDWHELHFDRYSAENQQMIEDRLYSSSDVGK